MHRPYSLIGLTLLLGACVAAFEPEGEQSITPPADYQVWWQQTEACSGRQGNFDAVYWKEADLRPGLYGHTEGRVIWVDRDYLTNRRVVSHEALHAILRGDPQHTDPAWTICRLWGTQ